MAMRNSALVLRPVVNALSKVSAVPPAELQTLCEIEVGLHLQRRLMPNAAVADAWPLFSGYPFARSWGVTVDERTLRTARYTLWPHYRQTAWVELLEFYDRLDRTLRGFEVPDTGAPAVLRSPTFAPDRWDYYDDLLRQAPPFTRREIPLAHAGRHCFSVGQSKVTVSLPERPAVPPTAHDLSLTPTGSGVALTFSRQELHETAQEMDRRKCEDWARRFRRVEFFIEGKQTYECSDTFSVERIQHLLGVVGAGKSTIRDIIAIHLVKKHRMRVTVIVGDVAEVLKLVRLYNTHLGDKVAAPIIGVSGRERHAQRLHRRIASRGQSNILAHDDPGFQYLSTSCIVNTLLSEDADPLPYNTAPCDELYSEAPDQHRSGGSEWISRKSACPYWSSCPRHQGARALIDAAIWVTTPAGLVDVAVPRPQNAERIRYLELACRRSDLVIVDEADRVQMQLDQLFAPAVSLVGGTGNRSLLDDLNTHRIRELAARGRTQLSDRDVANWTAAVNVVGTATDRLYAMLVGDHALRNWVRIGYFNAWTLQLRLIEERYEDENDPARKSLTQRLDDFRDNPFGDRRTSSDENLTRLAAELLHTSYPDRTRDRLKNLMRTMFDLAPKLAEKQKEIEEARPHARRQLPEKWLEQMVRRFEFTLLVSMLERKLSLVSAMWPRVEAVLKLDFNQMYRGPVDYRPVVPESPMGNVVGFQFLVRGIDTGGVRTGELRYFRCLGVGRELLRAMPGMAEVDGRPPTNVLLMSGSSWAGASSRYHLPVPVGVILKPKPDPGPKRDSEPEPEAKGRGMEDTEIRIEFLKVNGAALRVSGTESDEREHALQQMARQLGESVDGRASRLENELLVLPEERRHVLLLVGSYEETTLVADALHTLNDRWRGRVLRLVPDDDETSETETSPDGDDRHAGILRRGDVDSLAETPANILVAPLLAVERGHNILNRYNEAAIGTVYFLIRPNPRPEDIALAIHAVNDWIVRAVDSGDFDAWVRSASNIGEAAREVRRLARSKWYSVLARSVAWSRLREDRDSITWDLLVLMWQVIGRLVRGDVHARVVFVDAAFVPNLAEGHPLPDTRETSLLYAVLHVLRPYFEDDSDKSEHDRFIVKALYQPLWLALDRCIRKTLERS
jgi:hypothetical protein